MRDKIIAQVLSSILIASWFAAPAQSTSLQKLEICTTAVPAPLNHSVRMSGIAKLKSDLFALAIPTTGILGMEVAARGGERNEPVLLWLGRTCTTIDQIVSPREQVEHFAHIEHSARSHLVEIRTPGIYFVRVAAADPLRALGHYKLSNRFVEQAPQWAEAFYKSDDEEIDIDEWDEEILSLTSPAIPTGAGLNAFCGQGATHGNDFIWCATPIAPGSLTQTELSSPWGDDSEYFTFTLDQTQVLSITTFGSTNTFGTVYDSLGNRLVFSGDGGESDNFLIVKVLPPGQYRLRVESVFGSEGAYSLAILPEPRLFD